MHVLPFLLGNTHLEHFQIDLCQGQKDTNCLLTEWFPLTAACFSSTEATQALRIPVSWPQEGSPILCLLFSFLSIWSVMFTCRSGPRCVQLDTSRETQGAVGGGSETLADFAWEIAHCYWSETQNNLETAVLLPFLTISLVSLSLSFFSFNSTCSICLTF